MAKDIFEKMKSIHEVNRAAGELRRLGLKEKLKELADRNQVGEAELKDFLLGKRYFLIDAGDTVKTYGTARAKVMDEMLTLDDPQCGNVVGNYLLRCCQDPCFQKSALQGHKTLQRCLEHVMRQAYGLLGEDQKKARRNTAVAVVSDQVFRWVKEYYAMDDKASLEERRKKAEEEFQERNKLKSDRTVGKSVSKKKRSGTPKSAGGCQREDSSKTEIKRRVTEKGQMEGQVSLFGMDMAV